MQHLQKSFSHQGQDMILNELFREISIGSYLEIGAYQPTYINNTYAMYLNGWRGVCIDGNNSFAEDWKSLRPEDIFVNCFVSDIKKDIELYSFSGLVGETPKETMNSIHKETAENYAKKFKPEEVKKEKITTVPINDLLEEYWKNRELHLLCIDVEGSESDILKGIDFNIYMPGVIMVEIKNFNFSCSLDDSLVQFLYGLGYKLVAKTMLDAFFVHPDKKYLSWIPKQMIS
tara:strand:- start:210 stop:902 length:693 start_codon:yes stop_codon:yes gene_type:complete